MLNEIFESRLKWLEEYFYICTEVLVEFGSYKIIKRKQFMGIVGTGNNLKQDILPTIFDDITIVSRDLVMIRLLDKWGIYNIEKLSWILKPYCEEIKKNDFYNTLELVANNKHGLFDIKEKSLLIPIQYEDVTIDASCEYLWVKKNSRFHFVKKETGRFLSMIDAIMAYDTKIGLFVKNVDGTIRCVNELGLDNPVFFRSLMIKNRGRLKLQNVKLHESDIIDIYGFVLN